MKPVLLKPETEIAYDKLTVIERAKHAKVKRLMWDLVTAAPLLANLLLGL